MPQAAADLLPDLVQAVLGEADDVKFVDDDGTSREVYARQVVIGAPHVGDDDLDPILAWQGCKIAVEILLRARREEVEDLVLIQVRQDTQDLIEVDLVDPQRSRNGALVAPFHRLDEFLEDAPDGAFVESHVIGDAIVGVLQAAVDNEVGEATRHEPRCVE